MHRALRPVLTMALALLTATSAVAQRVPLIGVLSPGPASAPSAAPGREALEQGLTEAGWVPGQTIRIAYRYAESRSERLEPQARELVRLGADVIVARSTVAIQAAAKVTKTIPIVMSASGRDPVELGLVASLARPGGNVTGLTLLNNETLLTKQLEMLKETVPRLSRVGVLGSTTSRLGVAARSGLDAAARTLRVQLHYVDIETGAQIEGAFEQLVRARVSGLIVRGDPFVLEPKSKQVIALAEQTKLPAIYWLEAYARDGGLMSYGADLLDVHRRSAHFVDRILKGAHPASLPVEEPTKFDLIVNLTAAGTLGLTPPPVVVERASEVIR